MKPARRHRIQIGEVERVGIVLAGCGGTGSFAALHLARIAYEARRAGLHLEMIFCDPDRVEERNIGRQNFCPAEIGLPKAMALASRYNLAFGLRIGAVQARIGESGQMARWSNRSGNVLLVIGCVDSPAARREIAAGFAPYGPRAWWLDAGNDDYDGQVLIGNSRRQVIDPLIGCLEWPYPSLQEPRIVQQEAGEEGRGGAGARGVEAEQAELSCAELLALNVQSLMINQAMAGWIGVYASRLLLSRDLDVCQTWVNLRSGLVRSEPISDAAVQVVPASPVEMAAEGEAVAGECPQCGGALIEGQDVDPELGGDAVIDIVFCAICGWQTLRREWDDELAEMEEWEEYEQV